MPEQRVAEHLRRLPLFARLPESELAELGERVRTKTFRRGETIFRKDDPGAHLYMVLETLARTIRRLSDRVEDLIFLDVPSRVAKYLLDLARSSGDGTELTLTQDELAAFIGASRVSVNRVLGDLERREIISIRRRRIAIRDADRLAREIRL